MGIHKVLGLLKFESRWRRNGRNLAGGMIEYSSTLELEIVHWLRVLLGRKGS